MQDDDPYGSGRFGGPLDREMQVRHQLLLLLLWSAVLQLCVGRFLLSSGCLHHGVM
jgi:hypothetical protein